MDKYRLISVTDLEGNPKTDIIDYLEKNHSLIGTIPYLEHYEPGFKLQFIYDDDSGLRLSTSSITSITIDDETVIAETQNSIYTFEKCYLSDYTKIELVRDYCIKHRYFTSGSTKQYEKLFDMIRNKFTAREIAIVIVLCSNLSLSDVTAIDKEIRKMLLL